MIQFKRGKTSSWRTQKKPLADGQPGYDRDKHKIKIGDGKSSWDELPSASGLRMEEILISEDDAKKRSSGLLNPLELLRRTLSMSDKPIITYGTETPNEETIGQIYLQHYDTDPEVDYIVSAGGSSNGGWSYQKWASGIARCFITVSDTATMRSMGSLYGAEIEAYNYPFEFKEIPTETATARSSGHLVWLGSAKANHSANTKTKSATYTLLSSDLPQGGVEYKISIQVEGYWK